MVDQTSTTKPKFRLPHINLWSIGALFIAAIVLLPILSVAWIAFHPTENIWPHLMATTLPRYLANTLFLVVTVGFLSAMVGTGAAWLVVMYRFPFHALLQWALLLPLAIPAYIGAYALVDFLEYAGPVQSGLRAIFGWTSARDYSFPEIRSRGSAVLVLSAALYPYVYLMARTAFREQSVGVLEVSRALGCGPWRSFFLVGLPLARPAIAAGVAIVMMETANDFGTVEFFAVQTLTTGIFTVWLEASNAGGAAQIAMVILGVILILVALEKTSRRKIRFFRTTGRQSPIEPRRLRGWAAFLAFGLCVIPFAAGFLLPAIVIGWHALDNAEIWRDAALYTALWTTVWVGFLAAFLTVLGGVFLVYGVRLSGNKLPGRILPATTIGYAAPGAVLGIGVVLPLAALDHRVADLIENLTGYDPGLMLTGSAFAIVLAYFVRFFAIAQGAVDAAMGRISPSLPMASRSLGKSSVGTLRLVHLPMIKGSIATALLLVFVDCVKELPATLLLRPFNFNTLATRVYDQASLENLGEAAPAAIIVMAVGFMAVLFLARTSR
ncbi:MAG: iron(III) transport system permease protein [Paracoccaceae bacterium]|jgi:iron(III) transport system permease protein